MKNRSCRYKDGFCDFVQKTDVLFYFSNKEEILNRCYNCVMIKHI